MFNFDYIVSPNLFSFSGYLFSALRTGMYVSCLMLGSFFMFSSNIRLLQ